VINERVRWVGHVECMERRNAYKILVRKLENLEDQA
jgi:hypothetical protein